MGPGLVSVLKRFGTLIALVLLILFNLAVTPHFATMQTLSVNLTQVCTIVIVGVGMTLVIATGGIDLSVGSLMAIAGALSPGFFTGALIHLPTSMRKSRSASWCRSWPRGCSACSTAGSCRVSTSSRSSPR